MRTTDPRIVLPRLLVLLLAAHAAGAQVKGTITEVRVYRGQALVTRSLSFDAVAGAQELVVTELPEQVVPESLYATGDNNIVIRAVRLRTQAVADEPRDEVRVLDDQIKQVEKDLKRITSDLNVIEQQTKYLDKLEAFLAVTVQGENNRGTLNPQALMEISEFNFEKRQELAAKKLTLEDEQTTAQERLTRLQQERQKLTRSAGRVLREAVVFLEAAEAGAATIDLNYLVNGVGWAPAYIARLNDERDKLALEYHAVLTQTSGEDWPDVALTLSTSYPTMVADTPSLSPLWISLATVPRAGAEERLGEADAAKDYSLKRRALQSEIRAQAANQAAAGRPANTPAGGVAGGMGGGGYSVPTGAGGTALLEANVLAARLQNLELSASDEVVHRARRMSADTGSLAADYAMPGKVSLQSRNDPQMLRIATLDLDAEFYYTAVPLLSDYIYQAIEAVNDSDYALLPGPYNAYYGAAFAGRGTLPMTARGQSLRIGFGTETRFRASRELKTKQTDIRGGNKLLTYTYEIRLQNFTDQPANVRVWDRLPQPPDEQVRIELTDPGPPLSDDPLYLDQEKPRGLLRWDIEVPARAARADAHVFSYAFQLEFDKNYALGELPPEAIERIKSDFEMLQELRMQ